ncbi:MAG: hypothetical protein ABFQ65_01580 [Nanoarchaeota archaeon]
MKLINHIKKSYKFVIIAFVLILIFSFYFVHTSKQESFWITIHGCVDSISDQSIPNTSRVFVYQNKYVYEFRDTMKFSEGELLGETFVIENYCGEEEGYRISVLVPRPMELLVYTSPSFAKTIWASEENSYVQMNLTYGDEEYPQDALLTNNMEEKKELENLDRIFNEQKFDLLNNTLRDEIEKEFIGEAKNYIVESNNEEGMENQLKKLYVSHWFYYKGLYSIEYYSFWDCARETEKFLEKYNFRFHINPFLDSQIRNTSSGVFDAYDPKGGYHQGKHVLDYNNNISLMEDEIVNLRREYQSLSRYADECSSTLNIIKRDFESQDIYFKYKILFLIIISSLAILFGIYLEHNHKLFNNLKKFVYKCYKESILKFKNNVIEILEPSIDSLHHTIYIPLAILAYTGYIFISNTASHISKMNGLISLIFTLLSISVLTTLFFLKDKKGERFKKWGYYYFTFLILAIFSIIMGYSVVKLFAELLLVLEKFVQGCLEILFGNPI